MRREERFKWLQSVAGEIIKTPGSESNVKEIYDKVWELRRTRDDVFIFNQFAEFGNYLWHYDMTKNGSYYRVYPMYAIVHNH